VTGSALPRGGLTINANTNYWLRVRSKIQANGDGELQVLWSTDGTNFTQVMDAVGPSLSGDAMAGMVGVGTAGPGMPQVWFDDFTLTRG